MKVFMALLVALFVATYAPQPAYSSQLANVVDSETCSEKAHTYVVINTYFERMEEEDFLKFMDLFGLESSSQGQIFNNLKIMEDQGLTPQEIFRKMYTTCLHGFSI